MNQNLRQCFLQKIGKKAQLVFLFFTITNIAVAQQGDLPVFAAVEMKIAKRSALKGPKVVFNSNTRSVEFNGIGNEPLLLFIVNEVGQTILTTEAAENKSLSVKDFSIGTYYFRFSDGTKSFYRKVIVMD